MITTNEQKKNLISKLLEDKVITIDDAFMLLDESAPVSQPVYPYYLSYPYYLWDMGKVYVGDFPGQHPLTWGTGDTCTYSTTNDLGTISVGTAYITNTCSYCN